MAQIAGEAVRLLRIADGGVPAAPDATTLATAAAGLLGVAARNTPPPSIEARKRSEATPIADPASRSWWQRLFAKNR